MNKRFLLAIITMALLGCQNTSQQIETNITSQKIASEQKATSATEKKLAPKVQNVLDMRRTVNVFKAWDSPGTYGDVYEKKYGLYWTVSPKAPKRTLVLDQINWAFNYPRYKYDNYPGIKKFISTSPWGHDKEYGETYAIDLTHPDYAQYMANIAYQAVLRNNSHGIMLDWWHDSHPTNLSKSQIRKARQALVKEYRRLDDHQTIILGNVNDRRDKSFAQITNGVFLEHWKHPTKPYTTTQLFEMEKTLEFFDENLLEPKIIAFNVWKLSKTSEDSRKNRQSAYNRQYAKLFTAMSVVIPKNGYILYGDNNQDDPKSDHDHDFYDFYNFDIGSPTSEYIKIKRGVGLKYHDRGLITYNLTSSDQTLDIPGGKTITVPKKSGLFCKTLGDEIACI